VTGGDVQIREYRDDDEAEVLALLQASLGWVPDDQYARFFHWKHHENAFGRSPAWVALDGDRIVGFRIFLRWEYVHDGRIVRAVRAVDTATHPDAQGRGIFSKLTRHALEQVRAEGVGFVFNTPNDQSRPGYLKMGWQPVARLPVLVTPRSLPSLLAIARARVPADKWSQPTSAGRAAVDAFADHDAVTALLAASRATDGVRTNRTPEFLGWRYGFAPLEYRVVTLTDRLADGCVVFRLRRRGGALEAVICDMLVPSTPRTSVGSLLRSVLRASRADYAIRIGGSDVARALSLPLPGQGPTLVWRAVCDDVMPPAPAWHVGMGDIELF
jgi:GNAT superfamily N-acetyltransferase